LWLCFEGISSSPFFLSVFVRIALEYKTCKHTWVSPLPFVSPPLSKPANTAHSSYSSQRPPICLSCPSLKTITGPSRPRGVTPSTSGESSSVLFPLSFSPGLARAHQLGQLQGNSLDFFDDPNFDPTASLLEEESPYPEVRATVANTDDPKMASSTLRAWAIGLIWAILTPGVNQFFSFRYPSIGIGTARLQ
jgi:hypothetical protein